MVVVMPNGNTAGGFFTDISGSKDPYYKLVIEDMIPFVEEHYSVKTNPADRAYAGLSMGGLQAYNMALFYAEHFGYILPLSTGFFPNQLEEFKNVLETEADVEAINNLKLFWISMGGEKDIAYQNGVNSKKILDEFGITYQENSYPAGHTFITWRHDLHTFAPLLFRE